MKKTFEINSPLFPQHFINGFFNAGFEPTEKNDSIYLVKTVSNADIPLNKRILVLPDESESDIVEFRLHPCGMLQAIITGEEDRDERSAYFHEDLGLWRDIAISAGIPKKDYFQIS